MGRCSVQYVWYFSFSGLFWTATCLLIHIVVVNQCLSQIFQKFIKVSFVLRKYFITGYAFTSVHAMGKVKTRTDHQVVTHALFKKIWDLFPPSCLSALWLFTDLSICNDQRHLQDTPHWNWTIPSLNNLPAVHDTPFTATHGVIIVTLWMGLAGGKDKSWACEFIH